METKLNETFVDPDIRIIQVVNSDVICVSNDDFDEQGNIGTGDGGSNTSDDGQESGTY